MGRPEGECFRQRGQQVQRPRGRRGTAIFRSSKEASESGVEREREAGMRVQR